MADVAAHITGTVWKIEVKVGQQVSAGDTLVILESMKMETVIRSPQDGVIKRLAHKEGVSLVVLPSALAFYTIGWQRAWKKEI